MKILCSEEDCFKEVDLDSDVLVKPDTSYYLPSLKCWDCRTPADRKKIKRKRKELNRLQMGD